MDRSGAGGRLAAAAAGAELAGATGIVGAALRGVEVAGAAAGSVGVTMPGTAVVVGVSAGVVTGAAGAGRGSAATDAADGSGRDGSAGAAAGTVVVGAVLVDGAGLLAQPARINPSNPTASTRPEPTE